MSPPCVPFFTGDNGGETWHGVTADEVRVVAYFDAGTYEDERTPPGGTLLDLDTAPQQACSEGNVETDCAHILVRQTRAYATYFNDRFQTYGRRVHYYAYFSDARSVSDRRLDAVRIYESVHPFAVFDQATLNGLNGVFIDAITAREVMVFASPELTWTEASSFAQAGSLVWSFWPDLDRRADLYAAYVCNKIKPHPVAHMGSVRGVDPHVGSPRKFGLYYTESSPYGRFAELVKARLSACGVSWGTNEATFPRAGYVADPHDAGTAQHAAVERFRNDDVTTVLWLGGVETKFTAIAESANYHPEIIVAGDEELESADVGRYQAQGVWKNAWAIHLPLRITGSWTVGERAYAEGDPDAPLDDVRFGARFYRDHFFFAFAVQVTGPRLRPQNVDQALRAILERASDDPHRAAFYFPAGTWSGVKDAIEIWWDPLGTHPRDGRRGCMRMVDAGARTRAEDWSGATAVFGDEDDACNGFSVPVRFNEGSSQPPLYCTLPISLPLLCTDA